MNSTADPKASSSPEASANANASSQKTWGSFLYRNWKWLAGLMVLGCIIDFFDGKEAKVTKPQAKSSSSEESSATKAKAQPSHSEESSATKLNSRPSYSEESSSRTLPKVTRAAWGPTTLGYKDRYKLLDEPDQCKGKEYKMEVKYDGGGTRRGGKLEDCECTVFTDGNSYTMEFSFPSALKQPNIQVGDYLVLSFVFSGATKSFFSQPNVVTAVERTK